MTARAFPCAVCGVVLYAQTDTTENPESPELVRFEAKPWIGIVGVERDVERAYPPTLLVLCSSDCKNTFFRNGG
jgi:hypothetical protein